MKNFVRRWWKSHDTPEFQRSIVAGTIRRCTWSVSERACQLVIIMWLMGRETSSTSLRMCRNILKCVSKSLCGFLRFGQPSTSDFGSQNEGPWGGYTVETMRIRHMVPATMLRPNSGVSWDFHHRRTKFFISHV